VLVVVVVVVAVAAVSCGDHRAQPPGGPPDGSPDGPTLPACSDGRDDDGDGKPASVTDTLIGASECADTLDNNGDGRIDYPADPGCAMPGDNLEDTVCPGPACPACSDGTDNDGDTRIDYPDDPSCPAAGVISEACTTSEPIGEILSRVTFGTTVGAANDFYPVCDSSTGLAPDVVYKIDVPAMAVLGFSAGGVDTVFDTVVTLLDAACTRSLACRHAVRATATNLAAGTYFVSLEGYSGTEASGSCEGALFQSGAITCQPGFACEGTIGARTCRTQCTDGIDNNGDGGIDYPFDPGCSAPSDNSEVAVCPGLACPVCADGIDNDDDGLVDYPTDRQCWAAGATAAKITKGTTIGQVDDDTPVCGTRAGHAAPDLLYQIDLPEMKSLRLKLVGYDGVHSLFDERCGALPIACSELQEMTVHGLPKGRYFLSVDGDLNISGNFELIATGEIAAGGRCEGPLVSDAFTCEPGATCTAGVCR
jgi:hypothetical protein